MITSRILLCAAYSLVIILWSAEMWTTTTPVAAAAASSVVGVRRRSTTQAGGGKNTTTMVEGCPSSCGNLSFAYPFGVGPECSRGPDDLRPPHSAPEAPLARRHRVDSIDVIAHENYYIDPQDYLISTSIWRAIPMESGVSVYNFSLQPPGKSFSRSFTDLNITGCDLDVRAVDQTAGKTMWGCATWCPHPDDNDDQGGRAEITEMEARLNCSSGMGCCQVTMGTEGSIPKDFQLTFVHRKSGTGDASRSNLTSLLRDRITVSSDFAMLDWSIVDQPDCPSAMKNLTDYACISNHSNCYGQSGTSMDGYLCQCDIGYTGNPYVLDGCTTDQGYNPKESRADCTRQCGNISVPFPFGIEEGCFAREQFQLVCKNTGSLEWQGSDSDVIDLNVNEGTVNYTQLINAVYALTAGRMLFVMYDSVGSQKWVAANLSCVEAKQNTSGYACVSINSICVEVNSVGYRCKCPNGFEGNPYIQSGCQDIDECHQRDICRGRVCNNIIGGFFCTDCPRKTEYDPVKNQCTRTKQLVLLTGIIIGLSGGFSILLLSFVAIFLFRRWKRNVQKQQRRNYFLKNQGLLLEQLISPEKTNIFSLEELEKATNNFDPTRIIGHGGHGMVYKGILSNQRIVAIKKSIVVEYSEIKQFINEVAILSEINHRNVVKLFGCCLESEVPLLVYDYISNGSLSQFFTLHQEIMLLYYIRIAAEAAGALSYLHSAASISIFHRDVKSSNILLDGNYTAKVSDFGASRLVPVDQTHIVTNVQGTFGYLDPEYVHTRQLNEKSDVFSFGVVLLELLVRKKPVFTSESGSVYNLSSYFLQALTEKEITDIVDSQVRDEATKDEINSVASLAEILHSEERPTMKQVEMELQILRKKRASPCESNHENEQQNKIILLTRRSETTCQLYDTEPAGRACIMVTLGMMLCAAYSLVLLWSLEMSTTTLVAASSVGISRTEAGGGKKTTAVVDNGCPSSCGNLSFSYPFGVGAECSRGADFRLTCDHAARPGSKLFLRDGTEVIDSINVIADGNYYGPQNYIMASIWRAIPMKSGVRVYNFSMELPGKSFTSISTSLNITGCNLDVYAAGQTKLLCSTWCPDPDDDHGQGGQGEITEMEARLNCSSGMGCCYVESPNIPKEVFKIVHRKSSSTGTSSSNLTSLLWDRITVASGVVAVLVWSIVDQPDCSSAKKNRSTEYACLSDSSICYDGQTGSAIGFDLTNIVGYICQCEIGYTGNPYTLDGCTTDKGYNPKQSTSECTCRCGNISVSFPFGLEEGCFAWEQFQMVCTNATPSAILELKPLQVIDLNVNEGIINYTEQADTPGFFTGGLNLFVDYGSVASTLRWVAANLSCAEAKKNTSGYACVSINSSCVEVTTFLNEYVGYHCKCPDGFEGNPYIQNGCQDIDECLQQDICKGRVCSNIEGSFKCKECPRKTEYDPTKNQCTRTKQKVLFIGIIIGLSGGFIILLLSFVAAFLFRRWKRNVQNQQRRNYIRKNQGLLLERAREATNNFDPTRIIGHGGHGMVYKGILSDQRVVAVKKSIVIKNSEIKQFINEVAILSEINHRNIVKLFGCCLESEVPLLVYDYISNGSLAQVLHSESQNDVTMSWKDYIRIATEAAGALSYRHSAAAISIFHRDVKSSNILLDGNYAAKVSDFGASRLVPLDQTHIVTNVQGTFGYLDLEYFHTRQLNEKSDVYSFGVVLLELLVRKKPVFTSESGLVHNLSNYFLQALAEKEIVDIVDPQVIEEATKEEISSVANLAVMCLRLRGEERPTMKQVEMELQILQKNQHVSSCQSGAENEQHMPTMLPLKHNQRCYSLEEEFMESATLPR
ncbi:LOW QUALITY PROTEIN: hypothetical protein U9M48_004203 [Paspalum notatum var. saurae]|uniref:Protein kinase domain-containing protein n=1 Tax=Paspalum notatum var. saurae TaxID=547442 RepID=A0AAQ3PN98_PASNO